VVLSPSIGTVTYSPSGCNKDLAVGASCSYTITKSGTLPTSSGTGTITIIGTTSTGATTTVVKTFSYSVANTPSLRVSPASVAFSFFEGQTSSVVVTVINNSTLLKDDIESFVTIGTITPPAADVAVSSYTIESNTCSGINLAIGESCSYSVTAVTNSVASTQTASGQVSLAYTYVESGKILSGTNATTVNSTTVPTTASLTATTINNSLWNSLSQSSADSTMTITLTNNGTYPV